MIITTNMLLDRLKEYRYPSNKISRMVENQEIFPIVRGLYSTERSIPGQYLAASIYRPSYLSFEYALCYWNLIPEAVYAYTSATFDKKKKKKFKTLFGLFLYRDIPKLAYPFGIKIVFENKFSFLIAEPEKAICDKLYTISPISNLKSFKELLFDDLRIDLDIFHQLDKNKLLAYSSLYKTKNHKLLISYVRREFK